MNSSSLLPAMSAELDFSDYLKSIRQHYEKWWELYTLIDATGQEQPKPQTSPFDFDLEQSDKRAERLPALEGVRKYASEHILLVGRPGSGKSTTLARLLLEEAASTSKIPVLVELRYWQTSIVELICSTFKRHDCFISEAELEKRLDQNRFLFLFDGVNELPSEQARSQLSAFRIQHAKLPMIFTTRDLSLGGDLGIEKKLEMKPLNETQMCEFVQSYLGEAQGEQLLHQLKGRLRELGQTPLLLWMLCEVVQQSPISQLPENLGGIFKVFTQSYKLSAVRKHEVAALKGDVRPLSDRRLWGTALQRLAFTMMQGETDVDFRVVIDRTEAEHELAKLFEQELSPSKIARDCLDDLLNYHLLQIKAGDNIEFRHQIIQEYYAAEALLLRLKSSSEDELKCNYLNYLKWTEPIVLMLALLKDDGKALQIVKWGLDVDLMLGARLAGAVRPELQKQALEITVKASEKIFPEAQDWFKLKLLKKIASKVVVDQLVPFLDPGYINYRVRDEAYFSLLDIAPEVILKNRRNQKSVEWKPKSPQIPLDNFARKLPDADNIDYQTIVLELIEEISHFDPFIYRSAAYRLRNLSAKENVAELLDKEYLQILVERLEDPDLWLRWRIALTLWNAATEKVIPLLHPKLSHQDPDIGLCAALVLSKYGCQDSIPGLIKLTYPESLVNHPDPHEILDTVAYAFTKIFEKVEKEGKATAKHLEAITKHLPELLNLLSTPQGESIFRAILSIQNRCKFYNYEIYVKPKSLTTAQQDSVVSENYNKALDCISNVGKTIERNPSSFGGMGEEALRDVFLAALNGMYPGQVTGETFNRNGKTDILLRVDNRNILIGECKFWGGKQKLKETLDQLLGYATWHDDQLALLFFSRNKNFTSVRDQIPEGIGEHSSLIREEDHPTVDFFYIIRHPDDFDRELKLAVFAFDIPF